MSELILFGSANSSFVRTARLACLEKGVSYELRAVGSGIADLKTPEHRKRHPFGRIPAMQHGDFVLFESVAIARYVDEAFDGPALQPADLRERAVMNQWISAINHYIVTDMVWNYVVEFAFGSGPDGAPDQAKIDAAKGQVRADFELLDEKLAGRTYLAGDSLSIADLHLLPIAHMVGALPGGLPLVDKLPNLARWWEAMAGRASFQATLPPMLEMEAA